MLLFIHTSHAADTHSSPSVPREVSSLWPLLQMFVFQRMQDSPSCGRRERGAQDHPSCPFPCQEGVPAPGLGREGGSRGAGSDPSIPMGAPQPAGMGMEARAATGTGQTHPSALPARALLTHLAQPALGSSRKVQLSLIKGLQLQLGFWHKPLLSPVVPRMTEVH